MSREALTEDTKTGKGWAWQIHDQHGRWVLCSWVAPSQERLLEEARPSPEARMVHVAIVPMKAWRKVR